MQDKTKNIIKGIVLRLCMTAEAFYFIFTAIGLFLFVADPEPPMPVPAIITMVLHSVGLFVISIIGLRRINNGHKWVIIPNFALKHKYDTMIEYLLFQGMVNNYSCYPTYNYNSIIPSELHIKAQQNNMIVFEEKIYIR